MATVLDIFTYLRDMELGSKIKVLIDGRETEVELTRRGRQNVRVKDDKGIFSLVPLEDVIIKN